MNERATKTEPQHSRPALKIAEIITGDKYGSRRRFETAYGWKTVQGLADLIDNETHLPELMDTCQELLDKVSNEHAQDHRDGYTEYGSQADAKKCPICKRIDAVQKLLDQIRQGA